MPRPWHLRSGHMSGAILLAWETALEGTNWINIGARASHYPADPLALLQWSRPLREWVSRKTNPIRTHITPDALISLI